MSSVRWFAIAVGLLLWALAPTRAADPEKPAVKNATDSLGDPLPEGALARLGTVRLRHTHPIFAIAYSPDGKMLAAGDGDNTADHHGLSWHGPAEGMIRLWDPTTGKEIRRLVGHKGPIRRLTFSLDGKMLMSVSDDQTVKLWDPATGKDHSLAGKIGVVRCAAFSADGKMLAEGLAREVRLLDVVSGKEVRQFQPEEGVVSGLAFSADGKTIVVVGSGVSIMEVATGRKLPGRPPRGRFPAFSPDGKVLATAEPFGAVRLWDAAKGAEMHVLGSDDGNGFFAFSPDSKTVVTGRDGGTVLWDVATGKEIRQFGDNRGFRYAGAFSPDGKTLALSDDQAVRLFDVATGKEVLPFTGHASDVDVLAFSSDGKTLLTGGDGLLAWDAATGKERMALGSRATVGAATYTPDGKTIVTGYHRAQAILLREAATGKELRRFEGKPGEVEFVAMLAGNKSVVSMSRRQVRRVGDLWENSADASLRVWDLATAKEIRQVGNPMREERGYQGIHRAACTADGRLLAVGSGADQESPQIRVWDGASDRERAKLSEPGWVLALAFTPDGRRLVSAAFDPPSRFRIRLWELATGAEVWQHVDTDHATIALAISPDGRVIAAGDPNGTIRLWDLDTRKELRKLEGHQGPVLALNFSNGRRLVSGGRDTTALLWDVTGMLPVTSATRLDAAELKDLWAALAATGGAAALKAVRRLALAPEQALPLIRDSLSKQPVVDADRLARLVADLDADDFDKREGASAELSRLGNLAEPALNRALKENPSAELRRRAEELLKKMDHRLTPAELQTVRALEVLELIATPEARRLIESQAKRSASPQIVEEAKASLDRLTRGGTGG